MRDTELARSETRSLTTLEAIAARIAGGEQAIVGPWISEVGFEVLYWIPFLRQAVERYALDAQALTALSRGGVRAWYAGLCGEYAEIFDAVGVDEFRTKTAARWEATGGQKHMSFGEWDRELIRQCTGMDPDSTPVVHPALMYHRFRRGWRGTVALRQILKQMRFERWERPMDAAIEKQLPDRFAAVKFYFRPSFPDTPDNRSLVRSLIASLSETMPIVLLSSDLAVDDHDDFDPGQKQRVVRLLESVPAAANLHAQTIAISRAEMFVGTYGGLSYLASAYGVPAIAFASAPRHYMPVHADVARHAAAEYGTSLTIVDPRTTSLLRSVAELAGLVVG